MGKARLLIVVLLFSACASRDQKVEKYFDFARFLSDQASELSQRSRVLDKQAVINLVSTDSTFIPTIDGWTRELEIFQQIDVINLPAYQKSYEVQDNLKDPKSNLRIRQYTGKDAPVPWVKFYYQDDSSRLKIIEAKLEEKNLLFTNSRLLRLDLDDDNGKLMIHHYSMKGFQKMIFNDSVRFSVDGDIDW